MNCLINLATGFVAFILTIICLNAIKDFYNYKLHKEKYSYFEIIVNFLFICKFLIVAPVLCVLFIISLKEDMTNVWIYLISYLITIIRFLIVEYPHYFNPTINGRKLF